MQSLPFSSGEIIMAAAALISTALNWRFAASVSGLKLEIKKDIKDEIDSLRREFSSPTGFMSTPLAVAERTFLTHRIQEIEKDLEDMHSRYHAKSGECQRIANDVHTLKERMQQIENRHYDIDHRK